jgi:hypothetical protein
MRVKPLLFPAAALVLGFCVGYIVAQPLPPSGTGQYQNSPDGNWTASAKSLSEIRILERSSEFYSFSLVAPGRSSKNAREIRIEAPQETEVDWREEGEIRWNTNSTAVSFIHSNATWELDLKLKLPSSVAD